MRRTIPIPIMGRALLPLINPPSNRHHFTTEILGAIARVNQRMISATGMRAKDHRREKTTAGRFTIRKDLRETPWRWRNS